MNWVRSRPRLIQTPVSEMKYELGEIKVKIYSDTGQWIEIWIGWDQDKDSLKHWSVNWNKWVRSKQRSIQTPVSEPKQWLGEIKTKINSNTDQWPKIWSGWDQGKDPHKHGSVNWNMNWVSGGCCVVLWWQPLVREVWWVLYSTVMSATSREVWWVLCSIVVTATSKIGLVGVV